MRSYYRFHGVAAADLAAASWRRSSFSAASANCMDVARTRASHAGVRDTKDKEPGGVPFFTRAEWEAFMSEPKAASVTLGEGSWTARPWPAIPGEGSIEELLVNEHDELAAVISKNRGGIQPGPAARW